MWQFYSLLGLFCNACENATDKFTIVRNDIDSTVATFYRVTIYTVVFFLVGLFLWGGPVSISTDWRVISFGLLSVVNSLLYTYAIRNIEVTSIGTITYIGPILFLLVDIFPLGVPFSTIQIIGIILLVIGGIGFSIDGNTRRLKREISGAVMAIFLFWMAYAGVEAYLFKFLHATTNIAAPTFFANVFMWTAIGLGVVILIQRKTHCLFVPSARPFIVGSIVSKIFDAGTTLFASQALLMASVSQVSAMAALEPLVLLSVAFIFQEVIGLDIRERLDKKNIGWKLLMAVVILSGGFLSR